MNISSTDEYDDDENFFDGDTLPFEEEDSDKHGFCETCDQDYDGSCPENSPDCPISFKTEDDEEEDDVDDEDDSDFDDIDDIDEIVGYDAEAEKLIDEEEEIPPEDLVDEEVVDEEEVEEEEADSVDDEEDDDYLYQK